MENLLHEMKKEEQEVAQELVEKKEEMKLVMQNYKVKLEETKQRKQEVASQEATTSLE